MSLVRSTKSIQSSVTEKAMMRQRMEQFNLNSMRLLAGVCGLFTIFALTPVVVAQQSAAVQGGNVSVAAPATETLPP